MSAGSSSASRHWRNQRLTALALVPLTFWFLAALLRQPALDHATVSGWLARPLQALLATLFGAALLWHSLQGIQVVLEDYVGGRLHTVWLTIARLLQQVARAAHVFGPAGERDVGIPKQDRLRGRNDGLQSRTAKPVQRQRRRRVGHACPNSGDPRQIHVFRRRVDHVAEYRLDNVLGGYAGPRNRLAGDDRRQFARRNARERASEITNCRAHAGCDYNVPAHRLVLPIPVAATARFAVLKLP